MKIKKKWKRGTEVPRFRVFLGGDPSAGSPTDTLLRLNPPCRRQARIRHLNAASPTPN